MNISETLTVAVLALLAGIGMLAVAVGWILMSVMLWGILGAFVGWIFSGHFAVWEFKLGVSMSEVGAMLGFISAAFRVKISASEKKE